MIETRDRTCTILGDFIPGHEYEVVVQAIGDDGTQQSREIAARNTVVILGKQDTPAVATGLTATGKINAVALAWTNPSTYDFGHIEVWRSTLDDRDYAVKIATVMGTSYIDPIGSSGVTRYYWVRAVNTTGTASNYEPNTIPGVSATTLGVTAPDVDDFSITATKMFNKTIILSSDTWTNNSPAAGSIAWNAHSIVYNGAAYSISAGSTSSKYVYWVIGATGYSTSATHPTLGTTGFMIAINTSGTHTLVWNSSANMVIGNAFISDLSADKITAGTITGSTLQTASSGQRVVISASDNTFRMHTATLTNVVVIDDNISGSIPGIRVTSTSGSAVICQNPSYANDFVQISSGASGGASISTRTTGYSSGYFQRYRSSSSTYGIVRVDKLLTGDSGPWITCLHVGESNTVEFEVKDNGDTECAGYMDAAGGFKDNGNVGVDGSFNTDALGVSCSITVSGGIITNISCA